MTNFDKLMESMDAQELADIIVNPQNHIECWYKANSKKFCGLQRKLYECDDTGRPCYTGILKYLELEIEEK